MFWTFGAIILLDIFYKMVYYIAQVRADTISKEGMNVALVRRKLSGRAITCITIAIIVVVYSLLCFFPVEDYKVVGVVNKMYTSNYSRCGTRFNAVIDSVGRIRVDQDTFDTLQEGRRYNFTIRTRGYLGPKTQILYFELLDK